MKNCKGFFVFIEHFEGRITPVGLEILGKARELADSKNTYVGAIILGDFSDDEALELISYGADRVYLFPDPDLKVYFPSVYVKIISSLIKEKKPEAFFIGSTPLGLDLAPRIAARLKTGLCAHCVDIKLSEDNILEFITPSIDGVNMLKITCPDKRPQMATVLPGVFKSPKPTKRKGELLIQHVKLDNADFAFKVKKIKIKEKKASSLEDASVVVCGGYGIGSLKRWCLIEELAALLGGAIGATRPAVDEGWASEEVMIGQSGKRVFELYIGIGISGQMHHVVGIKDAKTIVVINKDKNAPFFKMCDFGVIGNFEKIIPLLIEKLKKKASGNT